MKIKNRHIFIWILFLGLGLVTCDNDDDNSNPIAQLPEATQEGRGIFGALVDGEPFVETGTFFNTFYQNVNGEFFFSIRGEFEDKNPRSIAIRTTNRTISQGETLQLVENEDGNAWGGVRFALEVNNTQLVTTSTMHSGTLTITKLDFENNIVSGTFEMSVINPFTNEIVQITDGRFDTLFTQ